MAKLRELKEEVANNCPRCGDNLKSLFSLMGSEPTMIYCPSCDIVKTQTMTEPYLCKSCHSPSYYNLDRIKYWDIIHKLVEKTGEIYDIHGKSIKDKTETAKIEKELEELRLQKPKNICWVCNGDDFFAPKIKGKNYVDSFYEMLNNNHIKPGFKLAHNLGKIPDCLDIEGHTMSKKLVKYSKDIFRGGCSNCALDFYYTVPPNQQERIGKGNEISIWDLFRTQTVKVIPFRNQRDLMKAVVNEAENQVEDSFLKK
ncbi:MAG: hypothetical protein V1678_03580 [Candidatus Aenigmatarchaeota archaeon]